jgi:Amt family ammonium transporter
LDENVNAQYAGLEIHYIYLMIMAFLVWLIVPGKACAGTLRFVR